MSEIYNLGEVKESKLIFLFVFIGIAFMESPGTDA